MMFLRQVLGMSPLFSVIFLSDQETRKAHCEEGDGKL